MRACAAVKAASHSAACLCLTQSDKVRKLEIKEKNSSQTQPGARCCTRTYVCTGDGDEPRLTAGNQGHVFPRSCFHSCNVQKSPCNMLSVSSYGWVAGRVHMLCVETSRTSRRGGNGGWLCATATKQQREHSLPPAAHGRNRKEPRTTGAESQSVDQSLRSLVHSLLWLHVCKPNQ